MFELAETDFCKINALIADMPQKVLPAAVAQGINPGRVFVDDPTHPTLALIWTPVGYYFIAGDPVEPHDLMDIRNTLLETFVPASQAGGENSYILIPSESGWKPHLDELLKDKGVFEIYRRPFVFNSAKFSHHFANWRQQVPEGFVMKTMDASLAEACGIFATWQSMALYMKHGAGFALCNEVGHVVSSCHSVFASEAMMEIDVHTEEAFQRRGFASLCAAATIEACLAKGKTPNWECFWDNDASSQLALKLGFDPLPDYAIMVWEDEPAE